MQPFFTKSELSYFLQNTAVGAAKERIDAQSSGSVYFSIELTPEIRNILLSHLQLDLSAVDSIPMRWIKGDTAPHIDRSASAFDNTFLVYLTDSSGEIVLGDETYPITEGSAYVFNEGTYHETRNTGTEPRLLLGPMSEKGVAVGGDLIISGAGGTNVYIRQTVIGDIEYSQDEQASWNTMYSPTRFNNTNTASGFLKVIFTTNITFIHGWSFIATTDNIQFGNAAVLSDGTRPIITIDGVTEGGGYPGLVRNGDSFNDGFDNIHVYNLDVRAINGSVLYGSGEEAGGWVCQAYFGKGAANNYIINCSSDGIISTANGGGIVGSKAGNGAGASLTIRGCSSSGSIGESCGGIIGYQAGANSGSVTCESCWSTGAHTGTTAGGIVGKSGGVISGSVTVTNCYSTGIITSGAGGICGQTCQRVTISNCYSTGNIGSQSGGIIGSFANTVTITNCYTRGNVTAADGGAICGAGPTSVTITNCYTTGTVTGGAGYITASSATVPATNYSEAKNSSSGWNTTNANSALTGEPTNVIGTVWVNTGTNQPYELFYMGRTPYSLTTVSGTPPNVVRTASATVNAGNNTSSGVLTSSTYAIKDISGGVSGSYGTITVNSGTGAISTSSTTEPGTYILYIRNTGSYNYTVYTLTVSPSEDGCCDKTLNLQDVDYTTRAEILSGNTLYVNFESRRAPLSHADLIKMRRMYTFRK